MIKINELLEAIINGELDEHRTKINDAFKIRSKNRGALQLMQLHPGMKVRLVNCQKQLTGATGTVRAINQTRVIVDLDTQRGKWFKGISCPPGLLEQVKEKETADAKKA